MVRERYLLFTALLAFLALAGCLGGKGEKLEEVLKLYGMDVEVDGSTIYWEAPGQSPYDIIYGMAIAKGACEELSMGDCTLVVLCGKEEMGRFSLGQIP